MPRGSLSSSRKVQETVGLLYDASSGSQCPEQLLFTI